MVRRFSPFAVVLVLLTAAPAWAQEFELHGFGGFRSGGGFSIDTDLFERLEIDEGPTFGVGVGVGYAFTQNWQIEFIWSRGASEIIGMLTLGGGKRVRLGDINTDQFHGNVVYRFGEDDKFVQFVFAGIGAARFAPDALEAETRLSWDAGFGMTINFTENFGLRFQGRLLPSHMAADQNLLCDPDADICLNDDVSSWMFLFEGTAGVIFVF
jgi:opacity protein-like surface antigen